MISPLSYIKHRFRPSFIAARIAGKIKAILRKHEQRRYGIIYGRKKYCLEEPKRRALLYFKTDAFRPGYKETYAHTNNWEISEIVKILNRLGFSVDIVDRKVSPDFAPEDVYDIFIGNAAGNSGKYYAKFAAKLRKAVKIFYAAGPDPKTSNKLIYKRYALLAERRPEARGIEPRRTIKADGNTDEAMRHTDYIFAIGNDFSIGTYRRFGKETFRIYPSSSPAIKFGLKHLRQKSPKNFLYFGGNGNIVKGLDLLIETFAELPEINLYICAPEGEEEFNDLYGEIIEKSGNIHFIGFTEVGGGKFEELTAKCGFVILPSCSEGNATSVTTCMRAGLIPVVTPEAGIDIGDFGFSISDINIAPLAARIKDISNIPDKEFKNRIIKSFIESYKYTQASFTASFEKALLTVLPKEDLL